MNNIIYILITILTVNLIRVLPVTLLTKRITNTFVRSFLYYVPYVTLAVMTFPAIIDTTSSPLPGILAFVIGILAALIGMGLFPVAIICCLTVLLSQYLI